MQYTSIGSPDGNPENAVEMRRDQLEHLHVELDRSGGLVVLSGPTGAAKTHVAYYALRRGVRRNLSVSSVESPIFGVIDGASQHVADDFWGGAEDAPWHRIVREPSLDLLYVRELQAYSSMNVVVTAASRRRTKFISTIHTVDALSVPLRLLNAGVDPWKVAAALKLVQAQRALRRLCRQCREPTTTVPATVFEAQRIPPPESVFKAVGCDACNGKGYARRVLVCQQLTLTDAMAQLIVRGASAEQLLAQAGANSLRREALRVVSDGETTVEEALLNS
jgi:type II secretory ATPase GspE/PulE/Tfp pilus assembly ATPase PilB-like protein